MHPTVSIDGEYALTNLRGALSGSRRSHDTHGAVKGGSVQAEIRERLLDCALDKDELGCARRG